MTAHTFLERQEVILQLTDLITLETKRLAKGLWQLSALVPRARLATWCTFVRFSHNWLPAEGQTKLALGTLLAKDGEALFCIPAVSVAVLTSEADESELHRYQNATYFLTLHVQSPLATQRDDSTCSSGILTQRILAGGGNHGTIAQCLLF